MNQRSQIAMSEEEIAKLLDGARKLQLGTINPDGTPHMVTMFYGLVDGKIAFWTYGKAQKARNIERDSRITCLIEDGDEYSELRGIMLYGVAKRVDDPAGVLGIGMEVTRRMTRMDDVEPLREYVEQTGRKRVGYVVEPTRVVSWDHSKLAAAPRQRSGESL
ncbi:MULTISPECIES: pyridoxamine 5'-phosphate oxidase family protein [Microtetraspora]|uniref:Pyridoxamine 5'-phosphate oxidase family protein n=1 Tax=Microtetraspora glauca TaxID=1996 RepID=A0ABV3GF20_MICGL|nr:pyridoxamine 5'-phosphate oxidase family protein [Microtetraspora sp. AC03309]MCC5581240.1 pyridoxamine 5'-phosphate oxidase family protein [Microtetraspora sp. AC03309]